MAFLSVLELLLPPHCHYPCTCVCANEEGHKKATQCIANKRFLRLSCAPVLALPLPLPSPLDAAEHTLVRCHYRTPFGALPWPTATQPPALSAAQRAFFVRQLRAFMLGFGPLLRLPNGARRQRRRRSRVQLELVCLTVWLSAAAFIPRDLRAFRMRFPSRLAVLWNKFKINWIKFNCTFFRILTSGLGHWLGGGVTSVRLYLLDLKCLTFIWIVNKNKSPRFVYILLCGLWLVALLLLLLLRKNANVNCRNQNISQCREEFLKEIFLWIIHFSLVPRMSQLLDYTPTYFKILSHTLTFVFSFFPFHGPLRFSQFCNTLWPDFAEL